ncbi:peptidoglycan-binding domain-containing protein [Sorangium sp. So ce1153]|uniref:peptidoglycan-binding domain-containing protein n=1 Tax=Sorangium sp. So ce1153 TaxID=3133333 RepID=UPI003F61A7B7
MSKRHRVGVGECISSIALRYGLRPEALWDHPDNAELKRQRPNMFQLVPGDEIAIPAIRVREEKAVTGRRHTYRRRGVPERLRVQLKDDEARPRAGIPYRIDIDGSLLDGATDGEGRIEHWIAPDARLALLTLDAPEGPEEYEIQLGRQRPAADDPRIIACLRDLGLLGSGEDPPSVIAALRAFQASRGIAVTGDADEETIAALAVAR